jgi:hypothetical protein
MRHAAMERHRVRVYLAVILAGLAAGPVLGGVAGVLEALIWPVLALAVRHLRPVPRVLR